VTVVLCENEIAFRFKFCDYEFLSADKFVGGR